MREDGTNGCRFCFVAQVYANGDNLQCLDGCLVRIMEVFLPDSENHSMQALYHCDSAYANAETAKKVELDKILN